MSTPLNAASFTKHLLVFAAFAAVAVGCKANSPDGAGGSSSIIASIPGVTGLQTSKIAYRLMCDAAVANLSGASAKPSTDLTGVATPAGNQQNVAFTGAKNAKANDSCVMQVKYSGSDLATDGKTWVWTSAQKTPGLFYSSNVGTLTAATDAYKLSLILYPTYSDTSTFVASKITVTFPSTVSVGTPLATGGQFTCDNKKGGTSTSAVATAQTVVYTFSVSPDTLVANSVCSFTAGLVASGPTYSQASAFTVVANQLAYTVTNALTLDVTAPSGQIAVDATVNNCPFPQSWDTTKSVCVDGTATNPPAANPPAANPPAANPPATNPPASQPAVAFATGKSMLGSCDGASSPGTGYWQELAKFNSDASYTITWTNYSDAKCQTQVSQNSDTGTFAVTGPIQGTTAQMVITFHSSNTGIGTYSSLLTITDAQHIIIDDNKTTNASSFTSSSTMANPISLAASGS